MTPNSTVALHTGRKMPVIGAGSWQLTKNTADAIETAIELGYPMIDTSGDYGTQPGVGEGFRRSSADRGDVYIVTKVEETDDAYEATKKDLDELKLDYADLMLIHRPPENGAGEKLWEGLMRAKEEGLARDIGVSNYPAELIGKLSKAGEKPVVNQIEWSAFGHSDKMLDYCRDNGIVIQAYSPLTRATRLDDEALGEIAARCGKTPAQVLLRWDVQRGVAPIPKANQKKHLEENIDIFDFEIGDDDLRALSALNERYSSLGELPYA